MSRYIGIAHRVFVPPQADLSVSVQPRSHSVEDAVTITEVTERGSSPAIRLRLRGAATAVGAGRGPDDKVAPYNSRGRRLTNLQEAVSRHERDLALATVSAADGAASRGLMLRLASRLHQARQELRLLDRA